MNFQNIPNELKWRNTCHDMLSKGYCDENFGSYADYQKYLKTEHGFENRVVLGRIGRGGKTHRLHILCRTRTVPYLGKSIEVTEVAEVRSYCGSAKFNGGYRSGLSILSDEGDCDCEKCKKNESFANANRLFLLAAGEKFDTFRKEYHDIIGFTPFWRNRDKALNAIQQGVSPEKAAEMFFNTCGKIIKRKGSAK